LKTEYKDQINEPPKAYPAFRISEEETLGNICHIDSSEASDEITDSYKIYDNKCQASSRYSFRQACRGTLSRHQPKLNFGINECMESDVDASNLISTSPEDEESEYFRKELGTVENNSSKKCSIAHFIEGNDIARRSIKCRHLNKTYSDMEAEIEFGFKNTKNEKLNTNVDLEVPNESNFGLHANEINVRIKGSNGNLSTKSDHSFQIHDVKPISNVISNDDEDKLHNFKGLKRSQTMTGPAVVINPPSPQNFSPNKLCDVEESHLDCRRYSFDSCRRRKYEYFTRLQL